MQENELYTPIDRHPIMNIVLVIVIAGLCFLFVGPFIGVFLASPFFPGSMDELFAAAQNPLEHPEIKIPLFIMQGCATFFGLIVAPYLLMRRTSNTVGGMLSASTFHLIPIAIVVFVVIAFMGVNSVAIEWNSNWHFPESMKALEEKARQFEDAAAELTKFLTAFDNPGQLLIGLLVIAVLPAIGEELVFRGLIQKDFFRATNNIHLSIWLSAILFSAIHMQFFGFVPRMLLGALFGYIYYWSGNLWLAILAHFVNNGVSVLAIYFYQQGTLDVDLETPEAAPMHWVIVSLTLTASLLYYFFKYFEHRKPQSRP